MSWLLNLYNTYKSNSDQVGVIELTRNEREYTLLPVSHTTQNAHIEVLITESGEFHSATVIDKNNANTLIPCTEDSASRAGSKIAPYPLHDKLSYVAGDYVAYGGQIKKEEPFPHYIQQLAAWAESPYATPKLKSIYAYLRQGRLIEDLVQHHPRILYIDSNKKLIDKWDKQAEQHYGDKPPIFSAVAGEQTSAFVRFDVYSPDKKIHIPVWKDPEMYQSFICYYNERLGDEDLCYVTGKSLPATEKHANKIRNAADKAKLISSNDTSGFTYRGRFAESGEAANISYEVSQKAHNALKWLINRQGKMIDQRVFLTWGNEELDQLDPDDGFFDYGEEEAEVSKAISYTNPEYAKQFAKALDGYRGRIANPHVKVNILVLDSATTGRMAVLYYRNMDKEIYINRLIDWHSSCMWLHRYRKDDIGKAVQYYGAPATKDIAFAAYGPKASEKVVKGLMERMLPCIIDGRSIPQDIVSSAARRASNPLAIESWEWEKTLSIACSLINRRERLDVALDESIDDRSYLFGRLLAVADVFERFALEDEKRATNAIRYMNAFSRHPARTWETIQASLQPYQAKLGVRATKWVKLIDEIGSRLPIESFTNKPLSNIYLLGYYSQRHALYPPKAAAQQTQQSELRGEIKDDHIES
ncbi:type I-C CRISPR-associated protein Cas8c/Csd1 [Paenibacillus sp. MMS18-CY102]|uniref:type I-C CRISPR-associated protein Cas8c/Csd1 n=1 Tax=Paenibacillus sp. MMS18-CY102 TaxID=2682849 RepID=UPI001365C5A7|nr:type I-C CRISPR-associated protein Cas8c/Csd1 [Paenibacillus sp. MMS18-CY102]MWC27861.1 type I-C CRISPR-associated protein Cas8c/Csd1 [Paenibacillus sp. MMS18-CY102]